MRPMHRIPSSIRVRRGEVDSTPTGHSSADAYAGPQTSDGVQRPRTRTPSQPTQPVDDYFGFRSWRRGSASSAAADAGERKTRTTPAGERRHEAEEDDDDLLREEMRAARRAIHDEQEREHSGAPARLTASSDYPPIRLSDEGAQPRVPSRTSSRRPGAVEGLAMRHHKMRKEERRRKREQVASQSTTSSHSSDPRRSASDEPEAPEASDPQQPQQPPHHRNLSDVQEEHSRSQLNIPHSGPTATDTAAPPAEQGGVGRARRNTVADDGLMATSRRLYDTLLRRRSERDEAEHALHASADEYSRYPPESSGSSSSDMHEDEVVDYLDVVDPEVATVTALQNVGNSIFFPPIPKLYNRRPTISLPTAARAPPPTPSPQAESDTRGAGDIEMGVAGSARDEGGFSGLRRVTSFASLVPRRKKRAAPSTEQERRKHIREWAEMDEEERNELDEHVHLLLTKKARFKRAMRGFGRYVRTPHGLIITVYAFSITFWGTAICLFLLKWIDVGNAARQRYWVEICDQILCALFAAVGLGFAPFRAVDTYRMVQIAHYHHLTWKRRRLLQLPKLKDKNELPRAAPRLGVAQMTNTMLVKSGLRKPEPEQVQPADAESSGGSARGGHDESDESWERLENVPSHRSEPGEVEKLKTKRRNKHRFLHRHQHDSDSTQAADGQGDDSHPADKAARAKSGGGYANKDGILPLGQLKRNPSIASELPRDFEDVVVLTPKQQANLEYQQRKFHASHTFYRYRETVTHRPFELNLMIAIVVLLDCHSCLQASLGGTTWGIYYKNRPTSVTATIITFSLSCNAVAGLLIWLGGNRTKKSDEVQRLLTIALEEEALRKIKKRQKREQEAQQQQQQQQQERQQAGESLVEQPKLECIQEH